MGYLRHQDATTQNRWVGVNKMVKVKREHLGHLAEYCMDLDAHQRDHDKDAYDIPEEWLE